MNESRKVRLSVNVDHVATLREARKTSYPDPVDAARIAEDAGADGITVHLREDRRHIQEHDIERLRDAVRGKLNLEMAGTEAMLRIATAVRPHQVTLVPERADEITTEGGLDLLTHAARVQRIATSLTQAGIVVSVFLDPDPDQIAAVAAMQSIDGFEINTDVYTRSAGGAQSEELDKIRQVARQGAATALKVYAGHGLTTAKVAAIAALPEMEELNIGHWLVSRATLVGMREAVREMLAAMANN